MFFAKEGTYPPCGLFTLPHIMSLMFLSVAIVVALIFTYKLEHKKITLIIRIGTITMCVLEILKIIYRGMTTGYENLNTWVPLYFCSIMMYAGLLTFFKNKFINTIGLSFLSTCGILGGISYIILPNTSLKDFPIFHFISFHSLFYHAFFAYLGILILVTRYYKPKAKHFLNCAVLITIISFIALAVNLSLNFNLMFLKNPFGIKVLDLLFNFSPALYTTLFFIGQVALPYWVVFGLIKLIELIINAIKRNKNLRLKI